VNDVLALGFDDVDLSDAWLESDESARWRSSAGHGPGVGAAASGSSLLEVEPGDRLPRHTDSAEETIVVVSGEAEVWVEGERGRVSAGGLALVPADAPHEVHSVGEEPLRFFAVYAAADVVSRYEEEVQPGGSRERRPVA
jgi:quercetin dioxygenase-like cupin family protein